MQIFVVIVVRLLELLVWLVIADALLSWVQRNPTAFPRRLTSSITDLLYAPIRSFIQPKMGGLDFTPLIVIVVLNLLSELLIRAMA